LYNLKNRRDPKKKKKKGKTTIVETETLTHKAKRKPFQEFKSRTPSG